MSPDGGADDAPDDSSDGKPYICGAETSTTDAPCQTPVSEPDARCHVHPKDGSGPPDGHGSGSPDHHKGDGDGKIRQRIPADAKPNMRHGIHAVKNDPFGTLDWLEDQRPDAYAWVVGRWQDLLDAGGHADDGAAASDLLTACLFDFAVRTQTDIQVREGLTQTEQRESDSGYLFEVEAEHPGNLPADRLQRRSEEIKRKWGVLDDPESKKAEAMGWGEAAKRVAEDADANDDIVDVDAVDADADADAAGSADR